MCQIFVNSNQVDVGFLWNSQRIHRDLTMGGEGCRRCTGALNDDAFAARPRSLLGPICLLSSLSDARASLWNVLENILEQSLSERLSSNFLAQIEGLAMLAAALGSGKRQVGEIFRIEEGRQCVTILVVETFKENSCRAITINKKIAPINWRLIHW